MAIDARQALIDLRNKLELEGQLRRQLQDFNRNAMREFVRKLGIDGTILNFSIFDGDLAELLGLHYQKVGSVFSESVSNDLPEDVAITDQENDEIASALAVFFLTRAQEQAKAINQTTQMNASEAHGEALDIARIEAQRGNAFSQQEIATTAGAFLALKLRRREEGIVSTETQATAEASKGVTVSVLAGAGAAILAGVTKPTGIDKEWVTVGDDLVRPDHVDADGQLREINQPFIVGGERLRWPGDTGLGASIGNIINCRCGSIHNTDQLISVRIQPGFPSFVEE